jgi:hypothetical protein
MMSTFDTVYMSYDKDKPPVAGERLVVYAPQRKIYDIKSKKVLGYAVQVMGEIEVESIAPKAAEGTVADALNPIERGYRVGPLRRRFRRVDEVEASATRCGRVVATLMSSGPMPAMEKRKRRRRRDDVDILVGEDQFVIVDLGREDKLVVGNVLEIVRKGDEYTKNRVFKIPYEEGWPRRVTGRLLVVDVQKETALALVIESLREIERGDYVELGDPSPECKDEDTSKRERRRERRKAKAEAKAEAKSGDGKAEGEASIKVGR